MAFAAPFIRPELAGELEDPVWEMVLASETEESLLKMAEAEMEEKIHQNAAAWSGRVPLGCSQPVPHDDDFDEDEMVDDEDYEDSAEEDVDDMDAGDIPDEFPDDLQADIDASAA